jgi:hypothetical protein
MATNDDLDDFFKKKDRKGNKHKKQSGLLTNNQELLKQLEIVTSATSAFKENLEFDDEDGEVQIHDDSISGANVADDTRKNPIKPNKTKYPDISKHINEPELILSTEGQPQDEWEDFEYSNYNYGQLRIKLARGNNDDDDDEFYDDENNLNNNDDNNDLTGDRQQQKDKPAWKMDQIKQDKETSAPIVEEKNEVPIPPKPAATGAYRPPQLRSGTSVAVVGRSVQRTEKKKEPNLASTDDFPTLRSTVNKK